MFEWWHWVVLGLCLAMSELAVPAFFIIWFGIAAIGVGIALLIDPSLAVPTQILLWAGLSIALVGVWFRYLKPLTVTRVGTSSAHVTGEVGILVADINPEIRGQVRFQKPVLGSDLWDCYADTAIKAGERVCIVVVEGSFIKVKEAK
ncbi:MAG: NfeD family protein [Propionivibrio sp.]|uniref:NfeD family protein n=1 Tax=Propionivibrio sp. TaxID=2212460 RepID=UPI0025E0480A|nr:NfeD family protein [Propionivibrio sp.]MBL0207918.1 NfeD family protein [Propionivibrio sp.]